MDFDQLIKIRKEQLHDIRRYDVLHYHRLIEHRIENLQISNVSTLSMEQLCNLISSLMNRIISLV